MQSSAFHEKFIPILKWRVQRKRIVRQFIEFDSEKSIKIMFNYTIL